MCTLPEFKEVYPILMGLVGYLFISFNNIYIWYNIIHICICIFMHVACYHHNRTPQNGDACHGPAHILGVNAQSSIFPIQQVWMNPIFGDQPMGFPSPWDSWMAKCPGGPDQSIATIVILPDEVPWRASRVWFFKKRGYVIGNTTKNMTWLNSYPPAN